MKIIKPEIIYVLIIAVILTAVVSDWYFFDSVANMRCGPCGCQNDQCGDCNPLTCAQLGRTCGTWSDYCGGTLNCGTCPTGQTCSPAGQCIAGCVPQCSGQQCGDDGCGGSCGTCPSPQTCVNEETPPYNQVCKCICTGGIACNTCYLGSPIGERMGWFCDNNAQWIPDQCGSTRHNCACPTGFTCDTATGKCTCKCSDGTPMNSCAITDAFKPAWCNSNCDWLLWQCGASRHNCGCPSSSPYCKASLGSCISCGCSDGTPCGQCTTYNRICEDGSYVYDCDKCPCAAGFLCKPVSGGVGNSKCCRQPTCLVLGKECGTWSETWCGGSVNCGSCPTGKMCDSTGKCVCQPQCSGKQCGPDGCGGTCGTCTSPNVCDTSSGKCICVPNCAGKQCGSDGCGGSCGTCQIGYACTSNQCVCQPQCSGKTCGPNGCGGTCGTCTSPNTCNGSGQCVPSCTPSCTGRTCGDDGCNLPNNNCGTCTSPYTCNLATHQCVCQPNCVGKDCGPDGCGGSCGTCTSPNTCNGSGLCVCTPSCSGKTCGTDGCGGSCGTCTSPRVCYNGNCCTKATCGTSSCGTIMTCGTTISCGSCTSPYQCYKNVCTCTPSCTGKTCGSDGCSGSCGSCNPCQTCDATSNCVDSTCTATWSGSAPNNCGMPYCSGGWLYQTRNCGGCDTETQCIDTTSCEIANSCTETGDSGIAPLVAGKVSGWQDYPDSNKYEWKDQCLVGDRLLTEYYCSGTQATSTTITTCVPGSCPYDPGHLPNACTALNP